MGIPCSKTAIVLDYSLKVREINSLIEENNKIGICNAEEKLGTKIGINFAEELAYHRIISEKYLASVTFPFWKWSPYQLEQNKPKSEK